MDKQFRDLSIYGALCLMLSTMSCFVLGLVLIVDVAGIELIGTNEHPYKWGYIYAGLYNLVCSSVGLAVTLLSYLRPLSVVPTIGCLMMVSAVVLDLFMFEFLYLRVAIPLPLCAAYLVIRFKLGMIRYRRGFLKGSVQRQRSRRER